MQALLVGLPVILIAIAGLLLLLVLSASNIAEYVTSIYVALDQIRADREISILPSPPRAAAPDMIALLGSAYRLKSDWRPRVEAAIADELGVTSRQMTSHELADALAGDGLDPDDPRAVPGDVLQV